MMAGKKRKPKREIPPIGENYSYFLFNVDLQHYKVNNVLDVDSTDQQVTRIVPCFEQRVYFVHS